MGEALKEFAEILLMSDVEAARMLMEAKINELRSDITKSLEDVDIQILSLNESDFLDVEYPSTFTSTHVNRIFAFADDARLHDDAIRILRRFPLIVLAFAKFGMEIQPVKTVVLLLKMNELKESDGAEAQRLVRIRELANANKIRLVTGDGCVTMGAPVGTDEYISEYLTKKGDTICHELDALMKLCRGTPGKNILWNDKRLIHSQVAVTLLVKCFNAQPIYLMRVLESRHTNLLALRIDAKVDEVFSAIADRPALDEISKLIRGVSVARGGFGCTRLAGHFSQTQHAMSICTAYHYLQEKMPHFHREVFQHCHEHEFRANIHIGIDPLEDVRDGEGRVLPANAAWAKVHLANGTFSKLLETFRLDKATIEVKSEILVNAYDKAELISKKQAREDGDEEEVQEVQRSDYETNIKCLREASKHTHLLKIQVLLACFEASNRYNDNQRIKLKGVHVLSQVVQPTGQILYWSGGKYGLFRLSNVFRGILRARLAILDDNLEFHGNNCVGHSGLCKYIHGESEDWPMLHYLSCSKIAAYQWHQRHNRIRDAIIAFLRLCPSVTLVLWEPLFGSDEALINTRGSERASDIPVKYDDNGYRIRGRPPNAENMVHADGSVKVKKEDGSESVIFFDVGVTVSARARNLRLPHVTAEDCPSVNPDTASRMRVIEYKKQTQYSEDKVGAPLARLPKLVIFACDHTGHIHADSMKFLTDMSKGEVSVKSLLHKFSRIFNFALGDISHNADKLRYGSFSYRHEGSRVGL